MTPADAGSGPVEGRADSARERLIALIEKNWAQNRDMPPDEIERAVEQAVAEARRRRPDALSRPLPARGRSPGP